MKLKHSPYSIYFSKNISKAYHQVEFQVLEVVRIHTQSETMILNFNGYIRYESFFFTLFCLNTTQY